MPKTLPLSRDDAEAIVGDIAAEMYPTVCKLDEADQHIVAVATGTALKRVFAKHGIIISREG
jgi:hypothetical protein